MNNNPYSRVFGVASLVMLLLAACKGGGDTSTVDTDASGPSSSSSSSSSGGSSGASGSSGSSGSSGTTTDAGGSNTCSLPQDVGPCDAAIPRFWFNNASGKCESFSFGGCQGNANNFAKASDCVAACVPNQTNPCTSVTCPNGTSCVFLGGTSAPECAKPCPDGGKCESGGSCTCGASCVACKNCVQVCPP